MKIVTLPLDVSQLPAAMDRPISDLIFHARRAYWTEAVQVTKTNNRPNLSSEGAPDIDKTVTVKQ
jgi:hypothetical protein